MNGNKRSKYNVDSECQHHEDDHPIKSPVQCSSAEERAWQHSFPAYGVVAAIKPA